MKPLIKSILISLFFAPLLVFILGPSEGFAQDFDFYLKSEPAEVSVKQGQTVDQGITGALIAGSRTTATLSVSGLPEGASASFYNPASLAGYTNTFPCLLGPWCESFIRIKTSPDTPVGKYPITVSGTAKKTGKTYTRTVKFDLNVTSAVAPLPAGAPFDFNLGFTYLTAPISRQPGDSVSGLEISAKLAKGSPAQVVSFSVSGLPPGTTSSFSPASSCVLPCAVSLDFKIPHTADGGDYPVTITGQAGSLTKTAKFTLSLTPLFDFYLKSEPAETSVVQGQTANNTISGALIAGDYTTAKLSVSGLPEGTTISFYPPLGFDKSTTPCRLEPSCYTLIYIKTSPNTPPGKYPITVSGTARYLKTGGDYTRTVKFNLNVTSAVAPVPAGAAFDFNLGFVYLTAPISMQPGQPIGGIVISAKLAKGSPQVASFSVSGLPPGTTSSFSPESSCILPCTVSLDIKVPRTADGGDYPVTITGQAGGLTKTAKFTLSLTPLFDFYLKSEPAETSVVQGQTIDNNITGALLAGDHTTATLSASGLPEGTIASFYNPTGYTSAFRCRLEPFCYTSVRIKTSPDTPPGKYPITISGTAYYLKTGGDYTRTATFTLNVTARSLWDRLKDTVGDALDAIVSIFIPIPPSIAEDAEKIFSPLEENVAKHIPAMAGEKGANFTETTIKNIRTAWMSATLGMAEIIAGAEVEDAASFQGVEKAIQTFTEAKKLAVAGNSAGAVKKYQEAFAQARTVRRKENSGPVRRLPFQIVLAPDFLNTKSQKKLEVTALVLGAIGGVNLEVSGQPAAVRTEITIPTPGTNVFILKLTTGNVPPGKYALKVTATNRSNQVTRDLNLVINAD